MKWTGILNSTTRSHNPRQHGFTLTEIAIVIGVIGILVGSIWAFANQSWENARQEQLKDEIFAVVKNIRAYYGGQAGVGNLTTGLTFTQLTPYLINLNPSPIPGDMVRRPPNAGACSNANSLCADSPWGDATAATAQTGSFGVCSWAPGSNTSCNTGGINAPFFAIELRDMSQAACIKAVLADSGPTNQPGFFDVVINGTSMLTLGNGLPPLLANVKNSCFSPNSNVVDFVYRVVPPQS